MKRIERLKLYPSKKRTIRLQFCLDVCRQLYNAALEQRRDAWRHRRLSITHAIQYQQLTELREADRRMASVYRELQDAALRKLELAFRAFFRRQRAGQTPGFPRFRAASRYGTLEFPHGNRAIKFNVHQSKVKVAGVGSVRVRKGREVPPFGRAMITRTAHGWFLLVECERKPTPLPKTGKELGLDVGIASFYAASDGSFASHLRLGANKARAIARAQRRVARRKRGSVRRREAVRLLARIQDALRWARRDWHHKLVHALIQGHDLFALEQLLVRNMTRSARGTIQQPGTNVAAKAALNQRILDAGWRQFANMLVAKAAEAERQVVFVKAAYSSQTCAVCHHVAAQSRPTRAVFACVACGHSDDADVNAAKVILKRAKLSPAGNGAELSDREDPRNTLRRVRTSVTHRVA